MGSHRVTSSSSTSVRRLLERTTSAAVFCNKFSICTSRGTSNRPERFFSVVSSKPPVMRALPARGAVRRTRRSRVRAASSLTSAAISLPPAYNWSSRASAAAPSPSAMSPMRAAVSRLPARPRAENTRSSSTVPPAPTHWSSRDRASRMPPSASRAMRAAPSLVRSMPSCPATYSRRPSISSTRMRLKENCWQRLLMVAGTL